MEDALVPVNIQCHERISPDKGPYGEILVLMVDALRKRQTHPLQKFFPEQIPHHTGHQITSLHECAGRFIQSSILRHISAIRLPFSSSVHL